MTLPLRRKHPTTARGRNTAARMLASVAGLGLLLTAGVASAQVFRPSPASPLTTPAPLPPGAVLPGQPAALPPALPAPPLPQVLSFRRSPVVEGAVAGPEFPSPK